MPEAINAGGTAPLPQAPVSAPKVEIQEVSDGNAGSTNSGTRGRARAASDTTTIGGDSRQSTFTL